MISVTQDEELTYLFVVPEIVGTNHGRTARPDEKQR